MDLKDKKTAMIVGGVILGAVVIYFLFRKKPLAFDANGRPKIEIVAV
jgi:hypothetical protein